MRATALAALVITVTVTAAAAPTAAAERGARIHSVGVCPPAPIGGFTCYGQILEIGGGVYHPRVAPAPTSPGPSASATPDAASTEGVTPPAAGSAQWLQQAYDLRALSATHGVEATIGIVDAYPDLTLTSDLATYRAAMGLPACTQSGGCLHVINKAPLLASLPLTALSGWQFETDADVEAVSALCPNCKLVVVEAASLTSGDLDAAEQTAVSHGATVIGNSWGSQTPYPPPGDWSFPGTSIVAAAGDVGYVPAGIATFPAALPNVTAVGATTLAQAPALRGFAETPWQDSSSGCYPLEPQPAWQSGACAGRAYADVSADGDPNSGLQVYDSLRNGWVDFGGTSLATQLVAAFEALTGVNGTTPQWAYSDSASLNPVGAGSNTADAQSTCPPLLSYLCTALGLTGYSGVAGTGSISGAVVEGAPGVAAPPPGGYAQRIAGTTVTLTGGVWTNGLAADYHWQYGTTRSYGNVTETGSLPAAAQLQPATTTLTCLAPHTLYHYRLSASNQAGTETGYDYSFRTGAGHCPSVPKGVKASASGKRGKHKPRHRAR